MSPIYPTRSSLENNRVFDVFSYINKKARESYTHVSLLQKKIVELNNTIIEIEKNITELKKQKSKNINLKQKCQNRVQQICTFNDTIIDSLLNKTLSKCSICLGNIDQNCIAITRCGHMFCKNCLSQSLRFNNKCAICRSKIKPETISLVSISTTEENNLVRQITRTLSNPTVQMFLYHHHLLHAANRYKVLATKKLKPQEKGEMC